MLTATDLVAQPWGRHVALGDELNQVRQFVLNALLFRCQGIDFPRCGTVKMIQRLVRRGHQVIDHLRGEGISELRHQRRLEGVLPDRHAVRADARALGHVKGASIAAKSKVKDELKTDASQALTALDLAFKEKSLPDNLDLAITGAQGLSITALKRNSNQWMKRHDEAHQSGETLPLSSST